jgi:tRNA G37 N-methylase TrmD
MAVPDILLSGNHPEIARWRGEQSAARSLRKLQAEDITTTSSEGENDEK